MPLVAQLSQSPAWRGYVPNLSGPCSDPSAHLPLLFPDKGIPQTPYDTQAIQHWSWAPWTNGEPGSPQSQPSQ